MRHTGLTHIPGLCHRTGQGKNIVRHCLYQVASWYAQGIPLLYTNEARCWLRKRQSHTDWPLQWHFALLTISQQKQVTSLRRVHGCTGQGCLA